ncbi:MAG: sodium:proton antiporter [Proteobacteria bacterium]|nr:MAG: sodium:proton antiporter [Pseudomonadota bacterium]PIE39896.1 MAG: sodium:proton antiporter [Gammaproteobacteria bacterium]
MYLPLAILATFAFLYSIVAGRMEKTPISGPIVFITFGVFIGPLGFGWLNPNTTATELKVMADLALAMLLFSDAANVKKAALRSGSHIPRRMLLIGLPGVIALGFVIAWLMFDELSVWTAAILATTLAATDAALGKAVVTNKAVPVHIRTSLNVESGLNDGLCVPVLFVFVALATAGGEKLETTSLAIQLVVTEIGIGVIVGFVITAIGYWLVYQAWKLGWITQLWKQLLVTMLALMCFAVAQSLHGSGYIAAFVGGFLFGSLTRKRAHEFVLATEGHGEMLGMLTWVLFGSVVIVKVIDYFTWQILLYSLLSLTLIRMLPIVLSLSGSGERIESKLFLAWFGPRGLASIVFAVIVLNHQVVGAEFIAVIVTCTVLLSTIVHGITANPLALALGSRTRKNGEQASNNHGNCR